MRRRESSISRVVHLGLTGLCIAAAAPTAVVGQCRLFYEALEGVPHTSLTIGTDGFTSIWDGETYDGCEVAFETNDSVRSGIAVPSFFADTGTRLHADGWRMRIDIGADGAGSGIHAIQREAVLCVVRWEQPAYIDDEGQFVQSDTLNIRIQCRNAEAQLRR